MDQKQVRFQEDDPNHHQYKCPIIGINDEFLDPYNVKNSMSEIDVLQQENPINELLNTVEQQDEVINIKVTPMTHPIAINQIVPSVLSIMTSKSQNVHRSPIDIVCVVDVSGSMIGKKINLVKDSLRYLMKLLNQDDRIAIVVFTTIAHIITPWTRNTPENKQFLKQTILELKGLNSTNIADGVKKGLWLIQNRKQRNPVTCMFLLSDGRDDYEFAEKRVFEFMNETKEDFSFQTFGYGVDHDAFVMNQIAKFKKGNFYFVEDINKIADYFILAMSGMLSVYALNLELILKVENALVQKVYGEGQIWNKNENGDFQIKMNYLLQGDNKEFVFELITDQIQDIKITIELNGSRVNQSKLEKTFNQALQVSEQANEINDYVYMNHMRAKSGESIGLACQLAQDKNYKEAQDILDKMIQQFSEKDQENEILDVTLQDLQKCKNYCRPKIFELEGEAYLMKKERNHTQRQSSLTNIADWNEDQQANMQQLQNGDLQLSQNGSLIGSENSDNSDIEDFDPEKVKQYLLKLCNQFKE